MSKGKYKDLKKVEVTKDWGGLEKSKCYSIDEHSKELLCGHCENDSFYLVFGNYSALVKCTKCGTTSCVYDG